MVKYRQMKDKSEKLNNMISMSRENGLKLTPQRMAIFDILADSDHHMTVDEVYQKARVEYPMLSPATVYRNMEQMVESGLLTHLDLGGSSMRYDTNLEEHHHFVCSKCGKVTDVYLSNVEFSLDKSKSSLGKARIDSHELHLQGTCEDCL